MKKAMNLRIAIVGWIMSAIISSTALAAELTFNPDSYISGEIEVNGEIVKYRAYEGIVYVANPVDTIYQSMNIYVPEAYFENGTVGSYNAENAPIFLPNQIGGYMPAKAGTVQVSGFGPKSGPTAIQVALSRGLIVAAPGARGRTLQNENGEYTGKAPAAIVDLKSAVRYLHFNDSVMPGDATKIISNGTSAGGALSSLLGASGNSGDYVPYLEALGAADAADTIYAVSAYCPITNLDHADAAYEWLFNGVNDYQKMEISRDANNAIVRTPVSGTLTEAQVTLSNQLKAMFPAYLNSLNLSANNQNLILDESGNGSFKDYVASMLLLSAQSALDKGEDLSALTWLTIENGKVTTIDLDAYALAVQRMKVPSAFDGINLETGENSLFGTVSVDTQHFTAFGLEHSAVGGSMADATIVAMMNPMNYIASDTAQPARYWRIRHGTADKDTSLAIPTILALSLQNAGYEVDFFLPWNQGHGGDYDLDELFDWIDTVVAK